MTAQTGFRTQVVSIDGRVKDTIHRPECPYVKSADSHKIGMVRVGPVDHRLYRTCKVCLKGMSTFRLPPE